ncbi:trypsin-like serine protease [Kitasatospora sp. NPDC059747]|uniref:trypsin-like serine protease n=1 Tax=Kitasatospora sp. NPDC059747 TaxID=3346930 RepID=UPI003652B73C
MAWPVGLAVAIPVVAGSVPAVTASAADAVAPAVVEDFSYPGAAKILADHNITLKAGDGHIVLADCASGPGLVELYSRSANPSQVCFKITGRTGYLSLEIPQIYNIKGDDHAIKATLNTAGTVTSVDVNKNAWTPVGEGGTSGSTTLLELNATDGPAATAPAGAYPAVGALTIGQPGRPGSRACTTTLVDPQWVLTAAACFGDKPAAGAPAAQSTVTIGGRTIPVVEIAPRTDRDLVMARLGAPVYDITPVAVSATAPATGEDLTVAGYGRTATTWVPAAPHTAALTAAAVSAGAVDLTAKTAADTVCKGDSGAPALRAKNGGFELAAVTSLAWQGGCIGETETRTGASEARVDDLASWVTATAASSGTLIKPGTKLTAGQSITGPGLKLTMRADGDLVLTHRQADGGVLWDTATGGNNGAWAYMQPDGNFVVYKADGNPAAGTGGLWATGTYFNNGAYLKLQNDGNFVLYKGNGGEGAGGALWSTSTFRGDATINGNTRISAGQWREGPASVLEVQKDGNVVLYRRSDGAALWASGTANNPGAWAFMQTDGNFVVYKADGNPAAGTGGLWASGTYMFGGSHLKLQDDGKLVMFKSGDETLATTVWSNATLRPISQLNPGYRLNAKTTWLEMQWDGNLVLHRNSDGAALWQSNTTGWGNFLKIQQDGNAVVYKLDGTTALWNSGTFWSGGSYLKLQDDGNLVVYKADGGEGIGGAIWSSNTFVK